MLLVIRVVFYLCLEGVMDVLVNILMIKVDDVSGRCVWHQVAQLVETVLYVRRSWVRFAIVSFFIDFILPAVL